MNIKLIKSESDYRKTLKRLDEIFEAKTGTQESDEADILGMLVDEYEKKLIRLMRDRECIFGEIENGEMILNDAGNIDRQ